MAIVHVGNNWLTCLSTDTKPTGIPNGYKAFETDTRVVFILSSGSWVAMGDGRAAVFFIAANDASAASKSSADYLCDGTDDDVQIDAAIVALPAALGRIVLSEGTFNVDKITANKVCTIEGQGIGVTTVKLQVAGAGNIAVFECTAAATIKNLTVDVDKANQTQNFLHGIRYTSVTAPRVENVEAKNANNTGGVGIVLDTCTEGSIENCSGHDCNGSGVYVTGGSKHSIEGHFYSNGVHGVDIYNSDYIRIMGTIRDNTSYGVNQDSCRDVSIVGGNYYNHARHIALFDTARAALRTTIVGNTFDTSNPWVVSEDTTSDYTLIANNTVANATSGNFYLVGPHSIAKDNTNATGRLGDVVTDIVEMTHTGALFDAVGLTDSTTIWTQPANTILLSAQIVLNTQFVATSMTDLDVTIGDAGDNDGIQTDTMNLTSDGLGTHYKGKGAYWNAAATGPVYFVASNKAWLAYATAVGANLSTTSAGKITFYFTYLKLTITAG